MAKIRKKVLTKVKKKWFPVQAPDIFNNQVIGEIPTLEAKSIIGRKIKSNMMTLTRDPKKQGTAITFEVVKVNGDTGLSQVTGIQIMPSSIKRMVRRNRNRIDGSYKVKTKDDYLLTVKPIVLTRSKARGSTVKALRELMRNNLVIEVGKIGYDQFVKEVVSHKIQRVIYEKLSKMYPLVLAEIRMFNLIGRPEIVESPKEETIKEEVKEKETPKEEDKTEKKVKKTVKKKKTEE
jgi:ribosomal protein S3AE